MPSSTASCHSATTEELYHQSLLDQVRSSTPPIDIIEEEILEHKLSTIRKRRMAAERPPSPPKEKAATERSPILKRRKRIIKRPSSIKC